MTKEELAYKILVEIIQNDYVKLEDNNNLCVDGWVWLTNDEAKMMEDIIAEVENGETN